MNAFLLRIKKIINAKNISDTKFAESCGIKQTAFSSMFIRDSVPKSDLLEKIIKNYNINPEWLLTGEGEMFTDTKEEPVRHPIKTIVESIEGLLIPYLDQPVSAGFGQELLNKEDNDRYICIPDTGGKKDLKALTVKGDSMEPTLKNGDIVVCDTGGWDGDGVYVIKTHEFTFVKRVVLQPEGYQVISDNKMYPPYQVPVSEDTVIVGKVYCAVVKM